MKSLKIWWYKRKARKAYIEYKSICAEYECCGVLTRNISPRAVRKADIFNSAMRELNKIDPSAPFFKI